MRAKAKEAAAQGQKLLSREVLRARRLPRRRGGGGAVRHGPARQRHAACAARRRQVRARPGRGEPAGRVGAYYVHLPADRRPTLRCKRASAWTASTTASSRAGSNPTPICRGLFSLQMDIEARAPTLDALMQHANGRIDFAVWPKQLQVRHLRSVGGEPVGGAGAGGRSRPRSPRSTARSRASTCATASSPRTRS